MSAEQGTFSDFLTAIGVLVSHLQACLPGKVPNRYLQGQKSGFAIKNRYKSFKA